MDLLQFSPFILHRHSVAYVGKLAVLKNEKVVSVCNLHGTKKKFSFRSESLENQYTSQAMGPVPLAISRQTQS